MEDEGKKYYGEAHVAELYATYRPYYPQEVFDKMMCYHNESKHCTHQLAVDVCCGPGRGSIPLTKYFKKVVGIDTSSDQLKYISTNCPNLETRIGSAEDLSMFGPNEVDLVTIAMALHYVEEISFLAEAKRILKPGGTFAAYSYKWELLDNDDAENYMNGIRDRFIKYYGPRSETLATSYTFVHFPFRDIKRYDDIKMPMDMSLDQYTGLLRSFHLPYLYDQDNVNEEPIVEQARKRLIAIFGEEPEVRVKATFTVFMILGRKEEALTLP